MLQLLLYLIKFILLGIICIAAITFLILTFTRTKQKKNKYIFFTFFVVCSISSVVVWNIDLNQAESEKTEDTRPAFAHNFGFTPPASVKEIKVKNYTMYDAVAHWMSFTYDSLTVSRIIREDTALLVATPPSDVYEKTVKKMKDKNLNAPEWLKLTKENTNKIYYKKDFMNHTFSEFYLWVDQQEKMVYLEISYFD